LDLLSIDLFKAGDVIVGVDEDNETLAVLPKFGDGPSKLGYFIERELLYLGE
jgi:hypothetical protein